MDWRLAGTMTVKMLAVYTDVRNTVFLHISAAGPINKELLKAVAHGSGLRPILIPIPFAAWDAFAWISRVLPNPPITRIQVELMQVDDVSSPDRPGFRELGISPHWVEEILQQMIEPHLQMIQ